MRPWEFEGFGFAVAFVGFALSVLWKQERDEKRGDA